ncbi:hypothetical protein GOODEAATRI_018941 [Goodea atripinnis]|uniref:Peptidase M20 dimerisation domain-containing protein n=1 Tax=Goodea atripinnis TaxID=208336 RepID=A0ABV0PZ88_9TELE
MLLSNSSYGIHQVLPVNVKFLIEGMEETGSNGLDAMILAQRDTFLSDVDYIIISDCGWLSRRPALTYGTRGNCYFFAEVVDLLAHRWRYPTVSIHGITGAFSDPGTKTVIPAKVTAKFSIRQVPDMDPATVTHYLHSVFAKRKSPNKLKVTMVIGAKPWLADTQHPLYEAGKAAIKRGKKAISTYKGPGPDD